MKSIELFSGAGGLALGLEQAGFETVALFERNADACATLRHNRPAWHVVERDVCTVNFADYGPVDLVAGGPPCQPFSMGGKARGFDDQRDMFPQAVRAVRELRPRAFIFENVRGLLRPAFSNYVEFIRLQLTYPDFPVSTNVAWETNLRRLERHHTSRKSTSGLLYNVTLNLADAADYGVPQRRHRVFFVGFRADLAAHWFFPAPTHSRSSLLSAQAPRGPYWREHRLDVADAASSLLRLAHEPELFATTERWRTVRDAIHDLGEPGSHSPFSNHHAQPGAKSYPGHTGSPLDEPAKALKAGDHGVPGGENMLRYANGRVRYFTIRESARIQTFPDAWRFPSTWSENMRQLGNAVPVRLARTVAASVAAQLLPHASPALQSAR
jgi:DNA (cytosine-5)-methyltransferase 1